jgi:hypothetical protein
VLNQLPQQIPARNRVLPIYLRNDVDEIPADNFSFARLFVLSPFSSVQGKAGLVADMERLEAS